jgi:putative toxin-antitoxin system antitoxin component (TIGR02293 family)
MSCLGFRIRDCRSGTKGPRDQGTKGLDESLINANGCGHPPHPRNVLFDSTTEWRRLNDKMSSLTETKIENLSVLNQLPQAELIEAITVGLPAHLARELARRLEITLDDLAGLLRLNPRTLQRRLDEGVLNLTESERLWELSRLFCRAVDVLETEPGAVHWFKNQIQALGGATPLSYARTAVGLRELDNVLGRIEHGVYS